jgi:hydrogenase maturation protease
MRTLVLGIGNRDRGDDGVGPAVAIALRERGVDANVRVWEGPDVDLLGIWEGHDDVIIIDASHGAGEPGTTRHHGIEELLSGSVASAGSTHALGLPAVLGLARRLDCLPARLELYTIEVADCSLGAPISGRVVAAADHLTRELQRRVGRSTGTAGDIAAEVTHVLG